MDTGRDKNVTFPIQMRRASRTVDGLISTAVEEGVDDNLSGSASRAEWRGSSLSFECDRFFNNINTPRSIKLFKTLES